MSQYCLPCANERVYMGIWMGGQPAKATRVRVIALFE